MHGKSKEALQYILSREPILSRYFNHNPSAPDFPTSPDSKVSFYNDFFCQVPSISLLRDICDHIRKHDYMCYAIRVPVETTTPVISIGRYSQLITESVANHLSKDSSIAVETVSLHSIIVDVSISFSITPDNLQSIRRFATIYPSMLPENVTWPAILDALTSQQSYDNPMDQKVQIIAGLLLYLLSRKNDPPTHLLVYAPCNTYTNITANEFLEIFNFVSMFLKHIDFSRPLVSFFAYYQLSAAGDPESEQFISYDVCRKSLYESNSYYKSDLFKEIVSNGLSLAKEYLMMIEAAGEDEICCQAKKLVNRLELLSTLCNKDGIHYDNVKQIPFQSIINYLDSSVMKPADVRLFMEKTENDEVKEYLEYSYHVIGLLTFAHKHSGIL